MISRVIAMQIISGMCCATNLPCPTMKNSPAVQAKIEWFMNNQDYLLRSASRAAPYLYYISQQVKKRHLPAELVLLPDYRKWL